MVILLRESAKCAYLWDGAATCVSFMLADIQTPKLRSASSASYSSTPLPTPPPALCLCCCMLHTCSHCPTWQTHMYVRQMGPLLCAADGNANSSRVRSLTQQPSANALNSARAGGLQRGVCVIFVAYKAMCTWPQRNYIRLCQRWGITFPLSKIKRSNCN